MLYRLLSMEGRRIWLRPTPNPLSRHCQKALTDFPDWRSLYADPLRPFHVDLGCGKGHLVYDLASKHPEMNFLGLELQDDRIKTFPTLPNLAYLCCNVNVNLAPLVGSFNRQFATDADLGGVGDTPAVAVTMPLRRVSIFYPDPWFKKRHAKRRMVTPELARTIHHCLDDGPDSEVYIETDFDEGFFEATDIFLQEGFVLETDEQRCPPFRFGSTEFALWVRENSAIRIFTATFRKSDAHSTRPPSHGPAPPSLLPNSISPPPPPGSNEQ